MPGYGYNMPDHFQQSVEAYLRSRRRLDPSTKPFQIAKPMIGFKIAVLCDKVFISGDKPKELLIWYLLLYCDPAGTACLV